eukprot:COSAG06_NODE_3817_length_4871_cov_2.515488_1_plen_27_part_10
MKRQVTHGLLLCVCVCARVFLTRLCLA